ncbi:p40 [Apocheima cinerarium nucleopolyhedrovirus]|uniref:p40 n=1 Tax=Apocheima cinerarium nucleopolyhedrovirus TaxID=307461 RepID=UPI0001D9209A|nr:p40 [Apocheima cinerarium nucleopolyhedrovirus]ADB84428.1 p40 [Apocheima cinerarium nucleopolyhedrovirus]
MSAVDLFNEMVILRDKIDPQMQMDIWIKLFPLLSENDPSVNLSFEEFIEFLEVVAAAASNRNVIDYTALASEHTAANIESTTLTSTAIRRPEPYNQRSIINIFGNNNEDAINKNLHKDLQENAAALSVLRKTCQKILQYYTLNTTTSSDFKIGDLVYCMLYLSKTPTYKPLYNLLEQTFTETYDCIPNLAKDQIFQITNSLNVLLELPPSTIDFTNIKLLRSTMYKVMSYPISRFPRIMVMPSTGLSKDKQTTLEDLMLDRGEKIARLESQQYIEANETSRVPYCNDEEYINELLRVVETFSLPRMFYNSSNSIFYTAMENYAITNCKFDIKDYNRIYKTAVDNYEDLSETCELMHKRPDITDSLNIFMSSDAKRKKY